MRKSCIALAAVVLVSICAAEPVCVDGVCYPDEETARAAGALGGSGGKNMFELREVLRTADTPEDAAGQDSRLSRRVGVGFMDPSEFKAFLAGEPTAADMLGKASAVMVCLASVVAEMLILPSAFTTPPLITPR